MYTFNVPKMSCGGCVNTIRTAILQVDENAVVEVSLPTKTVSVQTGSSEEVIIKAMSDAGYKPLL
ncbi:MAG: heavy metal transporter [Methylotenera sp.]|jgi:copper chaperone|nr:MAG: heavy metal transporter [Methylotenera sp.]